VKYAVDLVLLAKEETVVQSMTDRLIEIGRCSGMEMNAGENKVLRISKESSPVDIMVDQKQLENAEYFNYLGGVMTDGVRCTREIKPGFPR
jgi:hypothetical protein